MFEKRATHVGVATDHVIESFRNALRAAYKTGIEPALRAQFTPLEEGLVADLAQCVRGDRVVQVDRRGNKVRTALEQRDVNCFAGQINGGAYSLHLSAPVKRLRE